MNTNAMLLAVALASASPAGAQDAQQGCDALGEIAATFAQLRDAGRSREQVEATAVLLAPDSAEVAALMGKLVFEDAIDLSAPMLRLVVAQKCREGLEDKP